MKDFFIDENLNGKLEKDGFIKLMLFRENTINELVEFAKEQEITDRNTYTTEARPKAISEEKNVLIRNEIIKTVTKELESKLKNFKIARAYFMPKAAFNKSFIPPHQDPSITVEKEGKNYTILCWIPLSKTTLDNGTLGFLKGSHNVNSAPSPCTPDPRTPRFQDANVFELFPYLQFLNFNKGEVVFFSNRTFHGSLPNFSNKERLAIRLDIVPKEETLVNHFLKPNSDKKVQLCYKVDDNFFTKYTNEKLVNIYDGIESYPNYELLNEKDYFLSQSSIKEFINEINQKGHKISFDKNIQKIVTNGPKEKSFFSSIKHFFKISTLKNNK